MFKDLRHTYATLLYKSSGNNLRLVQQQLGHSSVQTTTVYANVMNEDVEKADNQLPARPSGGISLIDHRNCQDNKSL